jgi:glycosyltransferase involved in cell wall biosynthesis
MKVLILHQDIDGGTKNATEAIIEELKKEYPKHKFVIYRQKDPIVKGRLQYTRHLLWSIFDFHRYLNKKILKDVDCVYFNIYSCAVAKYLSQHKNTPSFFHFHGNQEFVKTLESEKKRSWPGKLYNKFLGNIVNKLQRFAFSYSNKVCFVSAFAKNQFIKQHKMQEYSHKTLVIPNGVNFKHFFPATSKEKEKTLNKLSFINSKEKIITYSGRIDEKKGINKIILALKKYKNKNIHLFIIHPKPREKQSIFYKKWLEEIIEKNNLKSKIHFFENPKNITSFYQISDLVLLPSEREYFSLVLLESFACGASFIGSKVGFIPEFLRKIDSRLILDKNTPSEIGKKLDWFFSLKQSERDEINKKGNRVSKSFNWNSTAKKIFIELKELIN